MTTTTRRVFHLVSFITLAACSLTAAEPLLTVTCEQNRKELGAEDLAKLPAVEIEALDHGEPHRYRGVAVRDVLALAGAPFGQHAPRGSAMALAVRVRAADGYVAAFGLAEFDPGFRENDILLVDQQDGKPLPEEAGPLRFVCPGDERGARWVRQIVSIEIISLAAKP
ncbi:MAG: molybdopterin-dependent oxidoreductase [Opitutaceae bacterium]